MTVTQANPHVERSGRSREFKDGGTKGDVELLTDVYEETIFRSEEVDIDRLRDALQRFAVGNQQHLKSDPEFAKSAESGKCSIFPLVFDCESTNVVSVRHAPTRRPV